MEPHEKNITDYKNISPTIEENLFFTKKPDKHLTIENKISDEIGYEINSFLKKHKRIYLEANPNYGKTYHFAQLGNEIKKGNSIYHRLIFCTPRLIIQKQIANDLDVDFILNGNSDLNKLTDDDKIITSTFNSLHLISNIITDKDLIIVDEAHELLRNFNSIYKENKSSYYNKTLQTLYNSTSSLVLMSGTPTYNFHKLLDLKHLEITKKNEIKTTVNINYSRLKTKEVAYRYCELYSEKFTEDHLNVIYIKNRADCGEIALYLNEKGFNSRAITSENKSDDTYLNIAKKSIIPENIQFVITTNVISVGTNILNTNIGGIVMINENDPIEIKQFSKRFRNAKNLTIDVSNKFNNNPTYSSEYINECHYINSKITFEQIQTQQKLLKTISNDEIKKYINISFEKSINGTPQEVINQTISKFLANESTLYDEMVKTYSTPSKLKEALKVFSDITPITSNLNEKLLEDLNDTKDKEAKKLFKEKLDSILDDFIENQSTYVIYSLKVLGNAQLEKKEKFKHFLSKLIDFSSLNMDSSIFKNTNSIFFESEVLDPILEYIPYFDSLTACLKFIKNTIPEQRKKHILSIYTIDLIEKYCDITDYKKLTFKENSNIYQSAYIKEKSILDITKEILFYLLHNRYIHIRDLRNHLENNKRIQSIIKKSDKNSFPFNMINDNRLSINFLLGLVSSLFILDSKKGRYKDKKGIQRRCYLFEKNTSKYPKSKTINIEVAYKKTKSSKKLSKEKSIRIISSKFELNKKFL